MTNLRWVTSLIAPARDIEGRPTQVVTGIVQHGESTQIALRAGVHDPVVFGIEAANELITNVQRTMIEKSHRDGRRT
jgi:hypothetical protein